MKRISATFVIPSTPILPDTDAETSIDLDKSVEKLQAIQKTNFTKSVFDITLKELDKQKTSSELEAYETRLQEEVKDWRSSITKALADLKRAKESQTVVDLTILSKERREFLEQEPDYSQLLRRMQEFRSSAIKFMEIDFPEIFDLQQSIADVCKNRQNLAKENFLAEELMRSKDQNL